MKSVLNFGKNSPIQNEYEAFGFEKFGPFLFGFVYWLQSLFENRKYEKIFFFSRDGYMMIKAFDVISDSSVEREYVYFSRNSLRQSLIYRCKDFPESLQYITKRKYTSIGAILDYYGFSEDEAKQIAQEYGCKLAEDIRTETLSKSEIVRSIYNDKKDLINMRSRVQSDLLEEYLYQIKMKGKCAIVDIGWHGSMQFYLETFIEQHGIDASIDGYYLGIDPDVEIQGKCHGFLFDENNLKARKSLLCFLGVLEKLFQSKEGSTRGYEKTVNGIKPLKKDYEYENENGLIKHINEFQNGALSYIHEAKKYKCGEIIDAVKFTKPLVAAGKYPSLKEVELFKNFYVEDGTRDYFVSQKPLFKYGLKELSHAISNSPWKTGFFKSLFIIPFPYYVIYEVIRK